MRSLTATSSRSRVLLVLSALVVTSVIILACGGSSTTGAALSGASATQTAAKGPAAAKHFKTGEAVNVSDRLIVTVNSVKTSQGTEFFAPKSGNTYLIVDVTIKNTSSKEENLSSLQWTARDSTGQRYTETFTADAGSPPDGKIEPGGVMRGQLAYEVPKSERAFTLAFEVSFFSSGQVLWDLAV